MNISSPGNPLQAESAPANDGAGQTLVIPVISEEVQVRTVPEHTGTVRVRKVVHEVSAPASAPGYREVVETLRVPRNQVVPAVQPPRQEGDVLVIPVYEERLVQQLVLLEEIHVTRRREPLPGSTDASVGLRREEVIVERLDPQSGQWLREGV
ncbi:MAG: YsnF/AvaK domain-containing protein [Pseudomonadota bacterium]|nr:YsnF/AvaK domain-containing protein [Pseudomonadota bacterium]